MMSDTRTDVAGAGIHREEHPDVFKAPVFATAPLALFWAVGFLFEQTLEQRLPALLGISQSLVFLLTAIALYFAVGAGLYSRRSPARRLLTLPHGIPVGEGLVRSLVWSFAAYLAGVPVCLALATWMTSGQTSHERGLFIWLFALWMPLWWSIPVGATSPGDASSAGSSPALAVRALANMRLHPTAAGVGPR